MAVYKCEKKKSSPSFTQKIFEHFYQILTQCFIFQSTGPPNEVSQLGENSNQNLMKIMFFFLILVINQFINYEFGAEVATVIGITTDNNQYF